MPLFAYVMDFAGFAKDAAAAFADVVVNRHGVMVQFARDLGARRKGIAIKDKTVAIKAASNIAAISSGFRQGATGWRRLRLSRIPAPTRKLIQGGGPGPLPP